MEGIIFSIEEFSPFDGPGIRTTVFLKGCPLCCAWCHNPEGLSFAPQVLSNGRRSGERYTPEALTAKLLKNADILRASGGGVTFSGGEPLAQPEFLLECLTLLDGKLHRALQTSGYAPEPVFQNLDYVLFDLKLMDEAAHIRYTGKSNKLILHNFEALAKSGIPFCVRIPLIPGITDTEQNISAIAAFMRENGANTVELLPYNKMAGGKYHLVECAYAPPFDEQTEPRYHLDIFEKYSIEGRIL